MLIQQVNSMKERQLVNIETGFKNIYKRLEEKKVDMIHQFTLKYDREIKEAKMIEQPVLQNEQRLNNIQSVYQSKSIDLTVFRLHEYLQ